MEKTIIDKFLTEMLELLKTAKDFTVEQVPQVAKEILHYSAAVAVVWLCAAFVALYLSYRFHQWTKKLVENDSDYAPTYIAVIIAYVATVPVILCNIMDLAKILLAPRLYLIEYLAALVAPHCGK